jgi:hypothetical protein
MNTDTSKYSRGEPKRQGKSRNSQYFRETKQSAQVAHRFWGTVDRFQGVFFKQEAAFLFWLKTITTRVAYRLWKRRARERQFVQIDYVAEMDAPSARTTAMT